MPWVEPVELEGEQVRLEPVNLEHTPALWEAGDHPELWRFMPKAIGSEEQMREIVSWAVQLAEQGTGLAFATRIKATGEVIGSTGFLNLDQSNKRLEIGYTWITPRFQRSAVNTECKLLMLQHAFERLGCNRVEFKTDSLNERSRAAIARLGAVEEGTLRNHMVQPDGRLRHSVYFSILSDEWPQVKLNLRGFLESHAG